jgi:hypothetical protein
MIKINFPEPAFRFKKEQGKEWIFDECRKKWCVLTPEEWVRQNILQYLIQIKKYPASLIAIEKEINLGELKKRFDLLVYKDAVPWMIIECKETKVTLNEQVLKQVLNYHISLPTPYLVITNGKETFGYHVQDGHLLTLAELPDY